MSEEVKLNKWSSYGLRILLNSAAHPFEYAKVLIQLGYEPIPARPTTTFFGKPAYVLPNIFQYVKYIKSVDGFSGCYRGMGIKICGTLVSAITAQKVTEWLDIEKDIDENTNDEEQNAEAKKRNFIKHLKCDIYTHTITIIISHPFQVMAIRSMAQFIGKENAYNGVFSSALETYKQSGILGFFSGLWPRLFGDLLTVILASSTSYFLSKYLVEDKSLQTYVPATMTFIASSVMYPFQVVSNCMAVNNSGLFVGSPPYMAHYGTWIDCWMDLSTHNQLKRGSTLINRYLKSAIVAPTPQFFPPTITKDSRYML